MVSLEPKKLLEILDVLDRLKTSAEVMNRRAFRRFPVRAQGTLSLDPNWHPGGKSVMGVAHVRDVSRGGVGLLYKGDVELRRPMRFVCGADGLELFGVTLVPRHSEELMYGVRLVGCAFIAEAALLLSMGVRAHELTLSEDPSTGLAASPGDFSSVETL